MITVKDLTNGREYRGQSVDTIARRIYGESAFTRLISETGYNMPYRRYHVCKTNRYGTHILTTFVTYDVGTKARSEPKGSSNTKCVTSRNVKSDPGWNKVPGRSAYTAPGGWKVEKVGSIWNLWGPNGFTGSYPTLTEAGRFVCLTKGASSNRKKRTTGKQGGPKTKSTTRKTCGRKTTKKPKTSRGA